VTRIVDGVGRRLHDVAEDRVLNLFRLDVRHIHGGLRGEDAEVDRAEVLERAAEGSERCAHAGKKDDVAVGALCAHWNPRTW
jgi:hypothetical protein